MPEVEPVPARHDSLSATSIADYLQCPFQFFVRKTLRLRERPKAPRDRLDALLQGNILHRALAEWTRAPLLGTAVLEQVFDVECAEAHVPRTYRTEAVRLELLRHFEAFTQDRQVQLGWTTRVEEAFDYSLNPALRLRGRLDRMDVSPTGQALVIDYKYSLASNMKDRIEEAQDGGSVQAGVYLLAVEHAFGLRPAGMLYCHVKKGVKWDGWHTTIPGLNVGERGTAERVRELARAAEESVLRVHSEITSGRVAVAPRDEKKCRWCAARDVCRKETLARASMAADA